MEPREAPGQMGLPLICIVHIGAHHKLKDDFYIMMER